MNQHKLSFSLGANTIYVGRLLAAGSQAVVSLGEGWQQGWGQSFCLTMTFPYFLYMSRGPRLGVLTCCCQNAASASIRSIIIILPLIGVVFPSFFCARSQVASAGSGKNRGYATGDIIVLLPKRAVI